MINVAVIESDPRLRGMLAEILDRAGDCRCIGAFANGLAVRPAMPALVPDVLLVDVDLPDQGGVPLVADMSRLLPGSEIIISSVFQDPLTLFAALAAGAYGHLVKPVMPGRLLEAVRAVREGGMPMSPGIAREVSDFFRSSARIGGAWVSAAPGDPIGLTRLERQVIGSLMNGLSYDDIALEMDVAKVVVSDHVRSTYRKLHACCRNHGLGRETDR